MVVVTAWPNARGERHGPPFGSLLLFREEFSSGRGSAYGTASKPHRGNAKPGSFLDLPWEVCFSSEKNVSSGRGSARGTASKPQRGNAKPGSFLDLSWEVCFSA